MYGVGWVWVGVGVGDDCDAFFLFGLIIKYINYNNKRGPDYKKIT